MPPGFTGDGRGESGKRGHRPGWQRIKVHLDLALSLFHSRLCSCARVLLRSLCFLVSFALVPAHVFAPRYELFCSRLREIGCNCVRARGGRRDGTEETGPKRILQMSMRCLSYPLPFLVPCSRSCCADEPPGRFWPCRCMANVSLRRTNRSHAIINSET